MTAASPARGPANDTAASATPVLDEPASHSLPPSHGLFPTGIGRMVNDAAGRNLGPAGSAAAAFPASTPNGAAQRGDTEAQNGTGGPMRLRDFLRLISNTQGMEGTPVRLPGLAPPAMRGMPNRPPVAEPPGGSLLDAVLDTTIDSDVRDLLTKIITPALEPGGFISFSIAGLGRFVLLFSEDDRSLRMIDLEGPFSLMIAQPRPSLAGGIGAAGFDPTIRLNTIEPSARGSATLTLHELLEFVRAQIVAFLVNPLTIGILAFSTLLWLIWRVRRRLI